jgi:hypothetical protein
LGKAFDTNPEVLYLHEPDKVDAGTDLLPFWFEDRFDPRLLPNARMYLERLSSTRMVDAIGTPPFFAKSYRPRGVECIRRSLIYAAKGLNRVGLEPLANRLPIPNFGASCAEPVVVVKSVTALGRAEILIEAAGEDFRPILLLRHPCAFVSSMQRGIDARYMNPLPAFGRLLLTRAARQHRVTEALIERSRDVERLAWLWVLANSEAWTAIGAVGGLLLNLDQIAANPEVEVASIFSYCSLKWSAATSRFIEWSRLRNGGYFSVRRDPERVLDGWRSQLSASIVRAIRDIVSRSPLGRLYFD